MGTEQHRGFRPESASRADINQNQVCPCGLISCSVDPSSILCWHQWAFGVSMPSWLFWKLLMWTASCTEMYERQDFLLFCQTFQLTLELKFAVVGVCLRSEQRWQALMSLPGLHWVLPQEKRPWNQYFICFLIFPVYTRREELNESTKLTMTSEETKQRNKIIGKSVRIRFWGHSAPLRYLCSDSCTAPRNF